MWHSQKLRLSGPQPDGAAEIHSPTGLPESSPRAPGTPFRALACSARGSARSHNDSTNCRRPHLRAGNTNTQYRCAHVVESAFGGPVRLRGATGDWQGGGAVSAAARCWKSWWCLVWSGGGAQPLRICTIQFQTIHAKLTLQPWGQIGAQAGGDHRTVPAGSHGRPWSSAGRLRPLSRAVGLA